MQPKGLAWAKRIVAIAAIAAPVGTMIVVAPSSAGAAQVLFPTVSPYPLPPHPSANHGFTAPASCSSQPTGAACEDAAIYDLDQVRHEVFPKAGPYNLPSDFLSLSPIEQWFVLSNLDRSAYGEPIYGGVNDTLSQWAVPECSNPVSEDPRPQASTVEGQQLLQWSSNYANVYPNIVFAYEAWMYDDGYGPGGPNSGDCPTPTSPGCWGHRRDILDNYNVCITVNGGPCLGDLVYPADLAYGASASGEVYRQLLASLGGDPPSSYTWSEAQQAGAGTHNYGVPARPHSPFPRRRCPRAAR